MIEKYEMKIKHISHSYEGNEEQTEEEIDDLQTAFNKERKAKENLEKEMRALMNEGTTIRQTYKNLEKDYTQRLEEMSQFLKKELEVIKTAYEAEKIQLLKFLDDERKRHEETRKDYQEISRRNEELENKLKISKIKYEEEQEGIGEELLSSRRKGDRLQREKEKLEENVRELELEIKSLKGKITNNETRTHRILELEMENSRVLEEINAMYSEREELFRKQRSLEQEKLHLQNTLKNLDESNAESIKKATKFQEIEYRFKMEIETITSRSEQQRLAIVKVEKEKVQLLKELDELRRSKRNDLEDEMRTLKKEKLRLEEERRKLHQEQDKITYRYESLIKIEKEKAEQYKLELESQRRLFNKTKYEGETEMIKNLETQISKLKSDNLGNENRFIKDNTELNEKFQKIKDDYEKTVNEMEMKYKHDVDLAYQHQCSLSSSTAMNKEIEKLREHYEKERREIEQTYLEENRMMQEEWERKMKEQEESTDIRVNRLQSQLDISMKEKLEAENRIREIRAEFKRDEEKMRQSFTDEKSRLTSELEVRFETFKVEQSVEFEMVFSKERKQMEQNIRFYETEIENYKKLQNDSKRLTESLSQEKYLKEKIYELEELNNINKNKIQELERQLITQKDSFANKLEHVAEDSKRENEELKRRLEHEKEMVEISRDALQRELNKLKAGKDLLQVSNEGNVRNADRNESTVVEIQQKLNKAEKRIRELELKLEEMKRKERELIADLENKYSEKLNQEKQIYESNLMIMRSEIVTLKKTKRTLELEYDTITVTCDKLKQKINFLEDEIQRRGDSRGRDVHGHDDETKTCGCAYYVYPERNRDDSPRYETLQGNPVTGRYYESGYAKAKRAQVWDKKCQLTY
jgi:hypothetical protein